MDFLLGRFAEALEWTLLHSVWGIALLTILLTGCFPALRQRSARERYLLGCAGLLMMLALPVATCFYALPPPASSGAVLSSAVPDSAAPRFPYQAQLRDSRKPCLPDEVLLYGAVEVPTLIGVFRGSSSPKTPKITSLTMTTATRPNPDPQNGLP